LKAKQIWPRSHCRTLKTLAPITCLDKYLVGCKSRTFKREEGLRRISMILKMGLSCRLRFRFGHMANQRMICWARLELEFGRNLVLSPMSFLIQSRDSDPSSILGSEAFELCRGQRILVKTSEMVNFCHLCLNPQGLRLSRWKDW